MTENQNDLPTDELRSVTITRLAEGRYLARNASGNTLEFGRDEELFSPVELLLAAIAGCSSIDVDVVTSRRGEPDRFDVTAAARKVTEDGANRLDDVHLSFDLAFPDTEAGRKAAGTVERAVQLSHEKYCTVSRTVQHGARVDFEAHTELD
ncbi:OsmC family protein [Brevibacterium sp. 50QC2O2]|jgi:putative redox protein|uniref:OsmC family protein n=1 Tax=unclassified Brevibacterium TaxID=2614124 RepID=UPI00211BAF3C|nr:MULTISPECIES: OsmC family protein [unclassified Brevibacterium]MCQ9368393.1 OsmC family protein [Brevibacterium sp. 91QC2O2]MCQ9387484.1 OsmC family protein [Brevibacterium sp. 50QC2O2]